MKGRAVVVGGGVFGLSAALGLAETGRLRVRVLERGRVPHPDAASTDLSKVCRMEYGADAAYMELMEVARRGWLAWNRRWSAAGLDPLYHETGVLMVCLRPMEPGGFEHDSFRLLEERGHRPERLGGAELARRFPAWNEAFVDGFYHRLGGWAESGRVVERLAAEGVAAGVEIEEQAPARAVALDGERVVGVDRADGARVEADVVVVAAGSWTGGVLSELAGSLRRTLHPVWHLRPREAHVFAGDRFPVFTADVARTGYYGFPLHPHRRVVKIGNHGPGIEDGNGDGRVPEEATAGLREFLRARLPALADAEIVGDRLCPYCDTQDGDFWIAAHPQVAGLVVAAGGSGHGFKFAPVLRRLIADAVEGRAAPPLERFGWRPTLRLEHGREAARWHGD
ncbi:MAG: FAD-dependent oxidoreductase [Thermoanaerobaculia bacterium]